MANIIGQYITLKRGEGSTGQKSSLANTAAIVKGGVREMTTMAVSHKASCQQHKRRSRGYRCQRHRHYEGNEADPLQRQHFLLGGCTTVAVLASAARSSRPKLRSLSRQGRVAKPENPPLCDLHFATKRAWVSRLSIRLIKSLLV